MDLNNGTFIWTATGDDGYEGIASEYDFRQFSDSLGIWESGYRLLTGLPKPPYSQESLFVSWDNHVYYWAIKIIDDAGNKSEMSNVIVTGISPITLGEWRG